MKTICAIFTGLSFICSTLFADIRYGVLGFSDGGLGIAAINDQFLVSVSGLSIENTAGTDNDDETNIQFNAKYRFSLDSSINGLIGIRYVLVDELTPPDDDSDESTKFALTLGIDHFLSKKILFLAETDVYSMFNVDDGETETSFFNQARIGIGYIF